MEHSKQISSTLETNHNKIEKAQSQVLGILNMILALNTELLNEFMNIQTFFYYVVFLICAFLLTSTERTISARFSIFFILFANIGVELTIIKYMHATFPTREIHKLLHYTRALAMFMCLICFGFAICCYRDYLRMNHNLLQEIKQGMPKAGKSSDTAASLEKRKLMLKSHLHRPHKN